LLSAAIALLSINTCYAETNAFDYYQIKVAGQIDHYQKLSHKMSIFQ